MNRLIFYILLFSSFLHALVFFNPLNKKNFSFHAESGFEFAPVYEIFFDKWKKLYNKSGKNVGCLNYRIESGFYWKNFYFGVFQREDYFLKTNEQTAEFVYQLLNNHIEQYKYYDDLYIYLKGFRSRGVNTSYLFYSDHLSGFIGGSVFKVSHIQDGTVSGSGYYADNTYDYNIHADYYYSRNFLYHININKPKGYGYTSHFGLLYKIKSFKALLLINDLFSRIYIKNTPYSNVYLNSNNKHIVNGYIHYSPIFYGVEKYKNYQSKYNTKYLLQLMYKNYFVGNERWFNINFPYLGFKWNNLLLKYCFRFKNLNLHFQKNSWFINLGANKINLKKSSFLNISIGVFIKF